MFRHPCSYLIFSESFDALPPEIGSYVWGRLWDVVTGRETGKEFQHLSQVDRQAIREILTETKPTAPEYWRNPSAPAAEQTDLLVP